MVDHDDLATLQYLDDHILNMQLEARYHSDTIYTYVGDILVAVNPYQQLDIYGSNQANRYNKAVRAALPPHIFAVADAMYQALSHSQRSQVDECVHMLLGYEGSAGPHCSLVIVNCS